MGYAARCAHLPSADPMTRLDEEEPAEETERQRKVARKDN